MKCHLFTINSSKLYARRCGFHICELYFETFRRKSASTWWLLWQESERGAPTADHEAPLSQTRVSPLQQERGLTWRAKETKLNKSEPCQSWTGANIENFQVHSLLFFLFFFHFLFACPSFCFSFFSVFFFLFPSSPCLFFPLSVSGLGHGAGCALWTLPAVMGRVGRWAAGGVGVPGAHEEVWTLR